MPARDVDLHRLAKADFRTALRWYVRRSPRSAARFAATVRNAVVEIAAAAESYPIERLDVRWVKLKRFPYLLYFVIVDDYRCRVVSIAHQRRRPGFWVRRLARP